MIWLDGTLYEGATAPFDLADRGLLLADGLFETITVFGGTPFRLGYHLERLAAGARTLGFEIDRAAAEHSVAALAARTQDGRGVVRVTVTRGSGPRGLAPPPSPARRPSPRSRRGRPHLPPRRFGWRRSRPAATRPRRSRA
ncbi:hypothetical protein F0357_05320 [Rhizobiales bacterium Sp-1]|uniref:Probable branched-chain-amino-acid aminotransferase n=1 Tax=Segnochrobactrum spirostomi TaxID=2608987 RepID=A0A6A7XZT1_9HYPH|nr:aminotransferase class IV [Segnochrobactrum spirostomi]MQT12093.1 hypothetical protein [Segnochrobactrum spirostomi]